MFDITSLVSNLAWWESFSGWVLAILFGAATIETLLKTPLSAKFPKTKFWLGWAMVVVILAGAAGELVAHGNKTILTAQIIDKLNAKSEAAHARTALVEKETATLNLAAQQADERAANLEHETRALSVTAETLKLAAKEADARTAAANERTKALELTLDRQIREGSTRTISEAAAGKFVRSIDGRGHVIEVILPSLQEPRAYGDTVVKPLLRKAKYKVEVAELPDQSLSKEYGIVVCDNGNGEARLYSALRKAGIQARKFTPASKERPSFCDPGIDLSKKFRVYIGQKVSPVARLRD